jgi:hypothetical protein
MVPWSPTAAVAWAAANSATTAKGKAMRKRLIIGVNVAANVQ